MNPSNSSVDLHTVNEVKHEVKQNPSDSQVDPVSNVSNSSPGQSVKTMKTKTPTTNHEHGWDSYVKQHRGAILRKINAYKNDYRIVLNVKSQRDENKLVSFVATLRWKGNGVNWDIPHVYQGKPASNKQLAKADVAFMFLQSHGLWSPQFTVCELPQVDCSDLDSKAKVSMHTSSQTSNYSDSDFDSTNSADSTSSSDCALAPGTFKPSLDLKLNPMQFCNKFIYAFSSSKYDVMGVLDRIIDHCELIVLGAVGDAQKVQIARHFLKRYLHQVHEIIHFDQGPYQTRKIYYEGCYQHIQQLLDLLD